MVLVDGRASSSEVIRAACRLATLQNVSWFAVQLDSLLYSKVADERVSEDFRLVEQLGGEVLQIQLSNAKDIRELAASRRVATLVLGRHLGHRNRRMMAILKALIQDAPAMALHVVAFQAEQPRRVSLPEFPGLQSLAAATLVVALATGVDLLIRSHMDLADLVMVYLLGITFVATRFGRMTALVTSLLSVGALDFCFIPPRFTFAVQDVRHLGTFGVMLGVGWIVAHLAERIRAQARMALEREGHASALNRLGGVLAEGGDLEAIRARVETYLRRELDMRVLVLLADGKGDLNSSGSQNLGSDEAAVAQWVLEHAAPAGKGTTALPGARGLFLPMAGTEHPMGVLALFPGGQKLAVEAERQSLLTVFAAQISLALERAHLAEERTEARIHAEEEQLRSTLLSSVSHDLRTPLAAITGVTTNLLSPGPSADPADHRMLLSTIHQEACRLQRLVNNMLDLTKLESGQVKVQKEWVPLEELVGSTISRMEEQLVDRPLQLDLPEAWVPVDPVLFEQVLQNLLDNALKYSGPGCPILLQACVDAEQFALTIADQGPGVPEGEEQRLFEKFYRGNRGASIQGSGLGLAICRGIIQAHGGTIQAHNLPAGGLQIRLTLPIEGAPPELPPEGYS